MKTITDIVDIDTSHTGMTADTNSGRILIKLILYFQADLTEQKVYFWMLIEALTDKENVCMNWSILTQVGRLTSQSAVGG